MSEETVEKPGERGARPEEAIAQPEEATAMRPEQTAAEPAETTPGSAQPAEKPVELHRMRQWVALRNASMEVRGGIGLSGHVAKDLRSVVGKPHACALVGERDALAGLVDAYCRDLSDAGFDVRPLEMPGGGCDLARVEALAELLLGAGITSDDLVVVIGRAGALSCASLACALWCGGVSLATVAVSAVDAIEASVTPRPLDLPGAPRMLALDGSARFSIVDAALFDLDPAHEELRHAFAVMAATAACDSNKAFERLWDATDDLVAGDQVAILRQLLDAAKSRGRVVGSTSAATRQSICYGRELAGALGELVGDAVPASTLLADGMRFSARLAVALEQLSVDDMFTQDELLERLGLGTCEVAVDPDALVAAIREERFRRTKRFMIATPRALGRVRLSAVPDDLLAEHVAAWCASR